MPRATPKPRLSRESAALAYGRFGGSCVVCGIWAKDWHHVFSQQKWPELADEPDNVVPVCRHCHEAHTHALERLPRRCVRHAETHLDVDDRMLAYLDRTYGSL